jgi:hypothetical protein
MRAINPQIVDALHRAATAIRKDVDLLESRVDGIDPSGGVAIGVLSSLPQALADRLLGRILATSGLGVTADRIERLWSVARGESDRQDLSDGLIVRRRNALLSIEGSALGEAEDDG